MAIQWALKPQLVLGSRFATGVGMAIAEEHLAANLIGQDII